MPGPGRQNRGTVLREHQRFSLQPVALHKPGKAGLPIEFESEPLHAGDVLLVQGRAEKIDEVKRRGELLVLDGTLDLPIRSRSSTALAIMTIVVALAAFGVLPIAVAATATRCCTARGRPMPRTLRPDWRPAAAIRSSQP